MSNGTTFSDFTRTIASIERKQAALRDTAKLTEAIGTALVAETKQHLRDWSNSHPNRLGGKRTHFIARAAQATFYRPVPGGLELVNNHLGLALRYYGGTVTPGKNPSSAGGGPTKWLTMPAISQAYGRRAREFSNLHFVVFKKDKLAALAEGTKGATDSRTGKGIKGRGRKKGTRPRVFYWLLKSMTIGPNRSLLPLNKELRRTARLTTTAFVRTIVNSK